MCHFSHKGYIFITWIFFNHWEWSACADRVSPECSPRTCSRWGTGLLRGHCITCHSAVSKLEWCMLSDLNNPFNECSLTIAIYLYLLVAQSGHEEPVFGMFSEWVHVFLKPFGSERRCALFQLKLNGLWVSVWKGGCVLGVWVGGCARMCVGRCGSGGVLDLWLCHDAKHLKPNSVCLWAVSDSIINHYFQIIYIYIYIKGCNFIYLKKMIRIGWDYVTWLYDLFFPVYFVFVFFCLLYWCVATPSLTWAMMRIHTRAYSPECLRACVLSSERGGMNGTCLQNFEYPNRPLNDIRDAIFKAYNNSWILMFAWKKKKKKIEEKTSWLYF